MAGPTQTHAPQTLEMTIPSDPARVRDARRAVESYSAARGFDEKTCGEIGLCLNEALANVIRHAYGGAADRPIVIAAEASGGRLRVSVRDWGNGRDPRPAADRPYDPLTPGGVGLLCLGQLMDRVEYRPQPDGMLLEMEKRMPAGR